VIDRVDNDEIELGALDDAVQFFLRAAFDASSQAFTSRTADLDVGPGEYATLTIIGANPGITQAQISAKTGRHMSTLTQILRKLDGIKALQRTAVPTDRRSVALSLTPSGERRLRELTVHAKEHENDLERIIGKQRKAEFVRILRRISALMP
jgi:DNA-binding MarR family transcriptional regulator